MVSKKKSAFITKDFTHIKRGDAPAGDSPLVRFDTSVGTTSSISFSRTRHYIICSMNLFILQIRQDKEQKQWSV